MVPRDNCRKLKLLQHVSIFCRNDQKPCFFIPVFLLIFREIKELRVKQVNAFQKFGSGFPKGFIIPDGSTPAHSYNLGLKSIGQNICHIVKQHVLCLCCNEIFCF